MGQWLGVLLAFSTAEPTRPITFHRLAFSMAELAWTDGRTGFLQERAEVGASLSSGFLLCAWVPNRTLGLFWFFALRLGTKQNIGFVLVFCFALGYQTEHWVCCGRGEGEKATRAIVEWRAEKEEKLVRFFSSLELLRKGEKRDNKEGFESLGALPLSWLGGVFVPFRTLFLFLLFVAWILGNNIKYMGVLIPSKWRRKKRQARADCVQPSQVPTSSYLRIECTFD